jgi:hypothetical protein
VQYRAARPCRRMLCTGLRECVILLNDYGWSALCVALAHERCHGMPCHGRLHVALPILLDRNLDRGLELHLAACSGPFAPIQATPALRRTASRCTMGCFTALPCTSLQAVNAASTLVPRSPLAAC